MEKDLTVYSDIYNGFVTKQDNYVWAGAMCLAWAELKNSIIKAPIELATQDPTALRMINNFNSAAFKADDLDPKCVYVKSGYGKKTLDTINKQVKEKFPQKTLPPLDIPMQDDSIISYAYFLKKLDFLAKFQRLPDKNLVFNNQHNCDAFYAQSKQHRKQIQFCEYKNKDNFVICLKSKNPKDLLFVIKDQNHLKVENVIAKCQQKKLKEIGKKDQFMMPVVQFDLHHSVNELKSLGVKNKGFEGYHIEQMFENVKIRIDQSGAKVQNQAVMVMNRCMVMHQEIKEFILDKPFWIVMKQAGKHPYLAVYIKNPIQTK